MEIVEKERGGMKILPKREIKEEDELKRLSNLLRSSVIQLEWRRQTPIPVITPENMVVEYYNYPDANNNTGVILQKAYKNITYKNLYPCRCSL